MTTTEQQYPKLAPLGWPSTTKSYNKWTLLEIEGFDRHLDTIKAYIKYLEKHGREDEIPCLACGVIGEHLCSVRFLKAMEEDADHYIDMYKEGLMSESS